VVSFNGNKVMTTSGGGMLLTDDVELAVLARRISSQARQPVAHYEHHEIGYNYRLSNVLAALGRAQLSRLDEMIARRHQVRARYRAALADVPGVRLLHDGVDDQDNAWLTSILLDDPSLVAQVGADLAAADIETRQLWKPLHCQPVFSRAGRLVTGESERMFRHGLTLPSGSVLTDDDVERVVEALLSSLSRTGTRR
jgi:dTDP-4-amino-4,6-dideoxygalactose transaminase